MCAQSFIAEIDDNESRLEIERHGAGHYSVEIAGVRHEVDARRFTGGNWSLIIDGKSYDVELEVAGASEAEGMYNVLVRGQVVRLRARDERHVRMGMTSRKFKVEGAHTVSAPMPGKLVKVLVTVGQEVQENAAVAIVEAMKMENELRTPKGGKVTAILAQEGQAVEAGAKLVTVE